MTSRRHFQGRLTWSGSRTLDRSSQRVRSKRGPSLHDDDVGSGHRFGDDFDDSEEDAPPGEDDDFGDFDRGFEGPTAAEEVPEPSPPLQDEPERIFVSRLCYISSQFIPACWSLLFTSMLIF